MKNKKLSDKQLKSLESQVIKICEKVGKMLMNSQKSLDQLKIHEKQRQGIATNVDLAAEKIIIKELSNLTPEFKILSEESAYINKIHNFHLFREEQYCWIVDPLDGTNNFVHGLDYFAVSIALVSRGNPVIGVVYRPVMGEFFAAVKGQGMRYWSHAIKRKQLKTLRSSKKSLSECLLATGFASEKGFNSEQEFRFFKKVLRNSRAVRRMGSAALDLCYLSVGRFDGFWEKGLAPWDVAAAALIVTEAKGKITDFHGDKFDCFGRTFLAARKGVHQKLLKLF